MKEITVGEILDSPSSYLNMLVFVKFRTFWRYEPDKNSMRQDIACYMGRITFISNATIKITGLNSHVSVPIGYFILIEQLEDPPLIQDIAFQNFGLQHKISEVKKILGE